jgi:regulator of protease activity HflC (stomatin/prohibitin superfamily)
MSTADHLSYRRATNVTLIGLVIQVVLAAVMLIYSRLFGDASAMTASIAMLMGIPIWVALALVFHQHARERLEALENAAFAGSTAAQASVFEGAGVADNQAQAQRLAWMHRWFLPSMSLLVAAGFIGIGLLRFLFSRGLLKEDTAFTPPRESGWAISIGLGAAVIGFIFARFVAGMAKQRVWALLHAGSATSVATALMGAALAVAHFALIAVKNEWFLRYLAPAMAIFMVALGAEMVLNFVLNLYRPRKVGEYQRPAFDSRFLAFVAAPDRLAQSISDAINYQFGFNVSSTWFYQLLARSVISLVALGGVIVWATSAFTVVRPHERGLLMRNGSLVREVGPGLVIDWPWPFTRVERFPAQGLNEIEVGTPPPDQAGPILWTNEHTTQEKFAIVHATRGAAEWDPNLIAVELPVHYVVTSLEKYKRLAQNGPSDDVDRMRRSLLKAVAEREVVEFLATFTVDELLGAERRNMGERLGTLLQDEYDRLDAGVKVTFTGVAGAHPEKTVAPAFEDVVRADVSRLKEIEKARADAIRTLAAVVGDVERARTIVAELDTLEKLKIDRVEKSRIVEQEQKVNELIASAGGEASSLISAARADRWQKHLRARARAVSSEGMLASYRAAPLPFKAARYLAALHEMTRDARVYIVPPQGVRVRLNMEQNEPIVTGFTAPDAPAAK